MIMMSKAEYVRRSIREQIGRGVFAPGSQIPIEPNLSRMFKVGRSSVREAMSSLEDEGLLVRKQGKGTFIAADAADRMRRSSKGLHVGLAYNFYRETMEKLNFMQDYVMGRGCVLTPYNISQDRQSPEKEKGFLEMVERERFAGVILLPTPIEPLNTEVYRRLRGNGIKVALVEPYADNMDNEVTFFADYYQCGYLAAAKMAMAGFRQICFATHMYPPSFRWMRDGVVKAAEDLGLFLLGDMDVGNPQAISLKEIPRRTGIVVSSQSGADVLSGLLRASSRKTPDDIGLCCRREELEPAKFPVSSVVDSEKARLKAAADYVLDPSIPATEVIHGKFKCWFEEHGTVVPKAKAVTQTAPRPHSRSDS